MNEDFFSLNLFASPDNDSDDESESETDVQNLPSQQHQQQQQQQQQQSIPSHPIIKDLSDAIKFLSQPLSLDGYNLNHVEYVISMYMGSMAQCRIHGKEINRLGGIDHLMTILYTLIGYWKLKEQSGKNASGSLEGSEQDTYELELQVANVILGALRDLSCGNALNRIQIGQYDYQIQSKETCGNDVPVVISTDISTSANARIYNGIRITSFFITRHAHQTWEEIPKAELKSMTNALGVARNITHSTPYNCKALHETGMTSVFIDRLLGKVQSADQNGNATLSLSFAKSHLGEIASCRSLPDSSKPWREACYRLAGTLINMAEKCRDAAIECAGDEDIIWILIDSWGGVKDWNALSDTGDLKKAIPVLHLGLFAVLTEKLRMEGEEGDCREQVMNEARLRVRSKNGHVDEIHSKRMLLDVIHGILENEKRRKLRAQERENSRKANR